MRSLIALLLVSLPCSVFAETVVAARTIRAQAIIGPEDISLKSTETADAFRHPADVIGQEARTALYAGRPIKFADIGAPALIDRNQTVDLVFRSGRLEISVQGRALERGGAGDWVRVMNLSSRKTVSGQVSKDGAIHVSP